MSGSSHRSGQACCGELVIPEGSSFLQDHSLFIVPVRTYRE